MIPDYNQKILEAAQKYEAFEDIPITEMLVLATAYCASGDYAEFAEVLLADPHREARFYMHLAEADDLEAGHLWRQDIMNYASDHIERDFREHQNRIRAWEHTNIALVQ